MSKAFQKEILSLVERNINKKIDALMASEKHCNLENIKRIVFSLKRIVQENEIELLQESKTETELGFRLNHMIKLNEYFLYHKLIEQNQGRQRPIYVCNLECKTKNERIA